MLRSEEDYLKLQSFMMEPENILIDPITEKINEQFNVNEITYSLLENVSNSIWHAFNSLDVNKIGKSMKNKLKVLSASLGSVLNVFGIEKALEDYQHLDSLTFQQYKSYLHGELFSAIPNELNHEQKRQFESNIDEVCWLVCRHLLLNRDSPQLPEASVYNLFRLFCFLGQSEPHNQLEEVVIMNTNEVNYVIQNLMQAIGREWDQYDFMQLEKSILQFTFSVFLSLLEHHYLNDVDIEGICEAIDDLCDTNVKGGYLHRKGDIFKRLRQGWFVLYTDVLICYSDHLMKEWREAIHLSPTIRTHIYNSKNATFSLYTDSRKYDFIASDHKTRLQWIYALQQAAEYYCLTESHQRMQAHHRKLDRKKSHLEAFLEKEKQKNHLSTIGETLILLQAEHKARICAEEEAHQLVLQQDAEKQKLKELQNIQNSLEKVLEEKKQALQDEEIVRSLQAREEWEKREQLEKFQQQQQVLLEEERRKRQLYEQLQQDKEDQLKEAHWKLKLLEEDRQRLDEELQAARKKIALSDRSYIIHRKKECLVRHNSLRESIIRRPRHHNSMDDIDCKRVANMSELYCNGHCNNRLNSNG